jgi:uncharacterized protein (DUF2062 family)
MVRVQKFYAALHLPCIYLRTVDVSGPMQILDKFRNRAAIWLCQGIAPRRLALTLAVGFVVGCIPVVGLPTALCAVIALAFRLNQPAIQAANYLAMPLQVALIVPLVRLGARMAPLATRQSVAWPHSPAQWLAHTPQLVLQAGSMAGQALIAWLLLAIPVAVLLTLALTLLLRRVPALAAAEAGD